MRLPDPDALRRKVPASLRQYLHDFVWDQKLVWRVEVETLWVPTSEVAWHLDLPFWSTCQDASLFDLAPRTVIEHPDFCPWQTERMLSADLRYPMDFMESRGRLVVLDGLHRLARCDYEGWERVPIRNIPRTEIPRIRLSKKGPPKPPTSTKTERGQ